MLTFFYSLLLTSFIRFLTQSKPVVKEDATFRTANSIVVPPLDVTVLTSDVSFLCDVKGDCHKRGLNRFWERTRPLFERNAIRSIEIVVATTGSIVLTNAANALAQKTTQGDEQ